MSDSDWRKFVKDRGGLILSATIATAFAIAVLSLARGWQWETDYEASHAAKNYAADADNQVMAKCGLSPAEPRNDCANKIYDAARKNQRDEYDLAAQRTMAIWTAIMGWMAVLGVGLSGLGIYLIWRTWDATQEAAKSSRKTLSAFLSKERAFLTVESASKSVKFETLERGVSAHILNVGNSPANLRKVEWSCQDENVWPNKFYRSKRLYHVIPATKDTRTCFLEWDDEPEEGATIYIVAKLTYETLAEIEAVSHFCIRVTHQKGDEYTPSDLHIMPYLVRNRPPDS